MKSYSVIRVTPSFERKERDDAGEYFSEERRLTNAGFDVFCPRIKVISFIPKRKLTASKRHSREPEETLRPLYRGYAFIRPVDDSQSVYDACDRKSIIGLVSFGKEKRLAQISSQLIEEIRQTVDSGVLNEYHGKSKHGFKVGDSASLECVTSIPAVVQRVDKGERITLLADLLGGARVTIRSAKRIKAVEMAVTQFAAHA